MSDDGDNAIQSSSSLFPERGTDETDFEFDEPIYDPDDYPEEIRLKALAVRTGLNRDQLTSLSIDCWFRPLTDISDVYWPTSLVVAWIAWRDERSAMHAYEIFTYNGSELGRVYWLVADKKECVVDPRSAENLLHRALAEGSVTAYGLNSAEQREPIEKHLWIDLLLFGPAPDDRLETAVMGGPGTRPVVFRDLRFFGDEVKTRWSATREDVVPTPKRPPGPEPQVWNRVEARMTAFPQHDLDKMTLVAMEAQFGASTTLCNNVRKKVQSERKE